MKSSSGKTMMNIALSGAGFVMILLISTFLFLSSCSTVIRKSDSENKGEITRRELWEFHRDIRYTIFMYGDGTTREGLLLRWKPDSILVQPRKSGQPVNIPAEGVRAIRVEIGNRIWESLALGTVAAGAYAGILKSWDLNEASAGEGIAKLLGPPAIILIATAIGSGMNKYEEYLIPDGFKFDFDREAPIFESSD